LTLLCFRKNVFKKMIAAPDSTTASETVAVHAVLAIEAIVTAFENAIKANGTSVAQNAADTAYKSAAAAAAAANPLLPPAGSAPVNSVASDPELFRLIGYKVPFKKSAAGTAGVLTSAYSPHAQAVEAAVSALKKAVLSAMKEKTAVSAATSADSFAAANPPPLSANEQSATADTEFQSDSCLVSDISVSKAAAPSLATFPDEFYVHNAEAGIVTYQLVK
jgi:hypothetical protein